MPTPGSAPGDGNADGSVTAEDIDLLIEEIFDGDGDGTPRIRQRPPEAAPGVDANGDSLVNAADITATVERL